MKKKAPQFGNDINLILSVVVSITGGRVELSNKEIADICGCHRFTINKIEIDALKKLKDLMK